MKSLNGKTHEQMTTAEWTALDIDRERERLRESVRDQINRCRQRLDDAERHLNEVAYRFPHSTGVLGNAGVELDILAGQYATVQHLAARLIHSLEADHRQAHPEPGEGVIAFFKGLQQE
jgi:hypothetical protein